MKSRKLMTLMCFGTRADVFSRIDVARTHVAPPLKSSAL